MKKSLSILFVLCAVLCLFAIAAGAADSVASGACGDNLAWELDDTGTLTISGTGDMWDYEYNIKNAPWYSKGSLNNVVICDGVTSIGQHAFYKCSGITAVTIPDSVLTIGHRAFVSCIYLESIDIPDSVSSIGEAAFHSCQKLVRVNLSSSITELSNQLFTNCENLTEITIPNGVTEIDWAAFQGCLELKNVTLPASVNVIEPNAFWSINNLQNVYYDGLAEEWQKIEIGEMNYNLTRANLHMWKDENIEETPTCTADGKKIYSCTVSGCSDTKESIIPATGHLYEEFFTDNNATCVEDGTKTAQCANGCGVPSTIVDVGSKNNDKHIPDENTNCTTVSLCTGCGATIRAAGEHAWDEGVVTTAPTCTEKGETLFTCISGTCGATKTEPVDALNHELSYIADGAVITETCSRNDHTATATLTAADSVYTGNAIETAQVACAENWQAGEPSIAYENNVNAGEATVSIAVGGVTANVNFNVAKAAEHTLTLNDLNQSTGSLKPVTATISPVDPTAQITVEYEITSPATPCTHAHDEACGYVEAAACTHAHGEACGYAEEATVWTTEMPSAVGSYPVRAWLTASNNVEVSSEPVYTTGELNISAPYYGGGVSVPSIPAEDKTEADKKEEDKPQPAVKTFADVTENAWYNEAVKFVTESGLMNGVSDSAFAPENTVTRNMVMTVLARMAGIDTEGGANWYEKAMNWAKEQGITDGSNAEGTITREQLVTMLYRYMKTPKVKTDLRKYTDADSVSEWAVNAFVWAVENGIITGMTETTLGATGATTRAQLATILMRFSEIAK